MPLSPRAPRLNATGPAPRPHLPRVARSPDRWATLTAPVRRALCRTAFQSASGTAGTVQDSVPEPSGFTTRRFSWLQTTMPLPAARSPPHAPTFARRRPVCRDLHAGGHPGLPTEVRRTEGRKTAQFRGFPAMGPCERFPAGAQPGAGRFAVPSSRQSFRTRARARRSRRVGPRPGLRAGQLPSPRPAFRHQGLVFHTTSPEAADGLPTATTGTHLIALSTRGGGIFDDRRWGKFE